MLKKWLKHTRSVIGTAFTVAGLVAICLIAITIGAAIVAVAMIPFAALGVWTLVGLQHLGWL